VPLSAEIYEKVMRALRGVVNGNGTGGARGEGFDVAGKPRTMQNAAKDKAGTRHKDHAWFVSFAPRAKAIYEVWYQRARGALKTNVALDLL